ncbi:unnamed protein product [Rhizoctonia solani]|uniref:S-formylglutathione hydrolase n=1 Tax=Rhizoctonia solani TaxID=456999 RepID=A0A8H3HRF5_9AGAM|nr:unnamed protein product [Rhizoctonia solani]
MAQLEQVAQNKAFGGSITKYKFISESLGGLETQFNLFVPEGASVPVVTYLAGLTCNEDTAPWKAGLLLPASQHSLALLFPDTSPRGAHVPTEDYAWDFGTGAGFYLDATASEWSKHYNMERLVTSDIQRVLRDSPVGSVLDLDRQSVMGHSMGGHGAITLYLKGVLGLGGQGVVYRAASGFAPILNPTRCPWGEKAFKGYLKGELEEGKAHDATELIAKAKGKTVHILADYGTADNFYKSGQLLPENFMAVAKDAGFGTDTVNVREREGYDHSYYFVSTFVPEHITCNEGKTDMRPPPPAASATPPHMRRYEIYQPPSFVARAPPRYYNLHLLSASARERIQRELAQSCSPVRMPSMAASVFSGVGSGIAGGSVRSSLSMRRPSMLAVASSHFGSAGVAGLETITASPASTAAVLHSPSLDPMNALNAGPAANHRLSTWLKRPPASPHTSMQPLPADATDLMDGTDPFGGAWHHSSPYDAGEMVVRRRTIRDSSMPDVASPHTRSVAGPSKKGPSPLSQSTSAINLTDTEPPLPEPPGSPDLLSGTRTKRKLSKRRSTSASRGGLTSLFTRKSSADEDHEGRSAGLRGRSRPPLSPSSQSLAQQGIAFPTGGPEKRPRRKLSKRRSRSSSAASVDSSRSIETPIHSQFARETPRDVEIVELPSKPQPKPPSQRPPSQRPSSFQHHRPPSSHHHSAPDPPLSPASRGPAPPSVTTNKPPRERKLSAASFNSFLSRITSRDKDKDKDKDHPRSESVQDHRKLPPHKLLNHVGKDPKSGNVFARFARKLSLIRRRSVDVMGHPEHNSSRPSFTVERRPPTAQGGPILQRRATLDLAPLQSPTTHDPPPHAMSSTDLFTLDPPLRLDHPPLSPPPRIPADVSLQGDRTSWATSLHRQVSTTTKADPPPALITDELLPPPRMGDRHPDSPHSIPKWGIHTTTSEKSGGPLLLENGSPTDGGEESPVSVTKGVLTVVNPDLGESERESVVVYGNEVALYENARPSFSDPRPTFSDARSALTDPRPTSIDGLKALRAQLEAAASPEGRRNRELPSEPAVGTKPLVIRKDISRSPSPEKALSGHESPLKRGGRESPLKRGGRESPVKRGGRESPVKRGGRESPLKRGKRDHSPVKPIRRTEPLKDHSAVNGADVQKSHGFRPVGSVGKISRSSSAMMASTTSVDAIQGDDDADKSLPREDLGRQRILRSRASTDSIAKMHVVTPKTSLQKIRARVVSNPPPVEISKESSPVKEDPPLLPERTKSSSKGRPRSGYTGVDSRHSIYGTATSESSEVPTSPAGPRKRISTAGPDAPPRRPPSHAHSRSLEYNPKLLDTSKLTDNASTPYMTPTDLHPFSEKPVGYQSMMPPISVMRFETASPPPAAFSKHDMGPSKMVFADSKGAWMDSPVMSPPPKAPFLNDEFSVSKEKLVAQGEFKKPHHHQHHRRESTAESERRKEAKEERARQRAERAEWERQERERLERLERERQDRERVRQERLERLERERERERLELERLEQEREQERLEQAERERAERERIRLAQRQREEQERNERIARERDRERVEKERLERERLELERERMERERAELARLEWERLERERLMEEEMRRRELPRRTRQDVVDGEREIPITSPKEPRRSKRRTPNDSRSTSPTSTVPPPPPKENPPVKSRQRSQTDSYAPPITSALPPPVQQSVEIIAGVPVLPHGTHVEVAHFLPRPTSVNTTEAPSLKARDAWERERLDKGQSVLVPGGQRAVIPDIGSPRPAPDPRQRQASSNKGRSQTPLVSHSEPVVPPLSEYGPSHSSYSIPTFPPSRTHNPLPQPPIIDGPFPLHRPAYTNPRRPAQSRPSGSRNPLPEPPRVSSYPLHHNVSPPRGLPPGAVR